MKVICPRCGQSINANPDWAGSMVNCPKCSKKVVIPEAHPPRPAAPSAEPAKAPDLNPKPTPAPKPASPAQPGKPPSADDDLDFDFLLKPPEERPKVSVTEDDLALAPEAPRHRPEVLLESETDSKNKNKNQNQPSAPKRPAPAAQKPAAARPKSLGDDQAYTPGLRPQPIRKSANEPCPNCGAQLPPDGMLCLECGYHLVLKRVLQADLRDLGVDSSSGFQRWMNSQLSEGESVSSMLWLLHAFLGVIVVILGLMYHPIGWAVVVPLYALYFLFVYWVRKSRVYDRWGEKFWLSMLRRQQRRKWRGKKAFVSHDREFTDQSLGQLDKLEDFEVLDLEGTSVSDAALRHIQYCAALTHIVVRGTRMTPAGVQRLQVMKPDAYIWS